MTQNPQSWLTRTNCTNDMSFFMYFWTSGLDFSSFMISRLSGKLPPLLWYMLFNVISVTCCQGGNELATYIRPWFGFGGGALVFCCGENKIMMMKYHFFQSFFKEYKWNGGHKSTVDYEWSISLKHILHRSLSFQQNYGLFWHPLMLFIYSEYSFHNLLQFSNHHMYN